MKKEKIILNLILNSQLEDFEYNDFNPGNIDFTVDQINIYRAGLKKFKDERLIKLINDKICEIVSHTDNTSIEIEGKLPKNIEQEYTFRGFFVKTKTNVIEEEAEGFSNVTPKYDSTYRYTTIISWNPSDEYLV